MAGATEAADVRAGHFWLADNDEHKVSGCLTLGQGAGPRLELDQALTPLLRELEPRDQPEGSRAFVFADDGPEVEFFVVHGALSDGTAVTLVDAFQKQRKVGAGGDRQWLQAQLVVLGGHLGGRDQLYTEIRLQLRHLDRWAALPGFALEDATAPGQDGLTLSFRGATPSPVSLQGGGQLDLEQTPDIEFSPLHGGRIGRAVWVRAIGLPPATIDDLERRFVTPLSSLLTLATDAACPPVAVEVATGPNQPWLTLQHSGLEAPAEEARTPDRQLLPLAALGLDGVATWLDAADDLGPLPPVVAAAAGSRGPLETQLLELTTVAEGLHRALFGNPRRLSGEQAKRAREAVRASVRDLEEDVRGAVEGAIQHLEDPSFPQRLQQLADCVGAAMPGVTGRTNRWKHCVTDIRNEFAHRDYGFLESARISELVSVRESLRWLLTGLLLLRTGLSPEELAARVESHQPYVLFRHQVRAWLPRIFREPTDE